MLNSLTRLYFAHRNDINRNGRHYNSDDAGRGI